MIKDWSNMKLQKGDYGYITYRKKVQLTKIIIGTILVIAVLVTGIVTTKTRNNLLTLGSILLVLPVANIAVNYIAMLSFKKLSLTQADEFKVASEGKVTSCDMIVTANQKLVPIQASVVYKNGIVAYSNSKDLKRKEAEENMNQLLKNIGCSSTIRIMNEWKPFIRQIQSIEAPIGNEELEALEVVKYDLLKYSI